MPNVPTLRSSKTDGLLVTSLQDFRRTWPQLIIADLSAKILALVVLTPFVALLVKGFLATTATGVLTDGAILSFLVHPTGIAALLVVGTVSLGVFFFETGQLMVIGLGAVEDRRVTWLAALRHVLGRAPALLELAGAALLRLLLIALPFLGVIAGLCWLLLREFDIHYYLSEKPPAFKAAIAITVLLGTVMGLWIITRIAGWLLALPMVLFDGMGGRQSLKASKELIASRRRTITSWLVVWIGVFILLSALVNLIATRLGNALIPRDGSSWTLLLTGLGVILVASTLAHFAINVLATCLFPLVVVRFYCSACCPQTAPPVVSAAEVLGAKPVWKIPGKPILLCALVAMVLGFGAGYLLLRTQVQPNPCLIIAHRGGATAAPENTFASFEQGILDGAVWLEVDVQEDADGEVVVMHDRDFKRIGGKNLAVHEATKAELSTLDVGGYFADKYSDQRVPTLREVLEWAKGKVGLFIELKYYGYDQSLEAKVVDLVEQTGMISQVVIMSLAYDGVRKTAELRPEWTYGFLNMVSVGDLTRLDVDFLALSSKAASFSTIRRAHRQGMKVYVWTINDPVQMSVMMSRGVDGVITDNVTLARHVQQVRAKLTPLGRFIIWMAGESGLLNGMEHSSSKDDA